MNPYLQYMYSYPHKTAYGPLTGVSLEKYADRLLDGETSLYFHIPFCETKCGYCNLFSVAGADDTVMRRYVDAMERQAAQWSEVLPAELHFADLTLGGGTPLLLPEQELERVFQIAGERLGFDASVRHTAVETSPAQTTEDKLYLLREHHVTRVSIGVQSFCGEELKTLHRNHSVEQAERALAAIRKVGFSCVNVDLIYGIPGQTADSLRDSVERALSYEPEELFVYPLYIKEGTYLSAKGARRPEQTYDMYIWLRSYLRERGYRPYSMRRFVKGNEVTYTAGCGFENTLSIGCGGRSYIGNLHFCTPYGVRPARCRELLQQYMSREDYTEILHGYILSEEEQRRRYVIKNILFACGLCEREYEEAFSSDVRQDFPILREWAQAGYVVSQDGKWVLTEKGFSLSDYLGPMLISNEVRERMSSGGGRV